MKIFLLIIILVLSCYMGFSQYQDRYWIFGSADQTNIHFDFYPNGPSSPYTSVFPPPMATSPHAITTHNGFESWSVATHPKTGELLFYTDGKSVFDATHADVSPVGGLEAHPSSTQPVAICALPVCPFDQYYIFSNPAGVVAGTTLPLPGPVTYSMYNSVTKSFSASNNLPGPYATTIVGEGLMIIPNRINPFEFWLLTRLRDQQTGASSNTYVVYQIDSTGIQYAGDYQFGPLHNSSPTFPKSPIVNIAYRNVQSSPADVLMGFTVSRHSPTSNHVFTRRFDSSTGTFVGPTHTIANFSTEILYDLEFSPSGRFLYYASYFSSMLFQAEINPATGQLVSAPVKMNDFGGLRGGGLKLAPDGFIYHVHNAGIVGSIGGTVQIGRIIQPDVASTPTNLSTMYEANSFTKANTFAYNFPEFVNTPTWTTSIEINGDSAIFPGDTAVLHATVSTGGLGIQAYTWYYNGSFYANTSSPMLNVTLPGTYSVVLDLVGDCTDTSNIVTLILLDLPAARLSSFETQTQTGKIQLNWQTSLETNSDFFAIEHSTDKVEFRQLGKVKAKGESESIQTYSFVHEGPFLGNNYYRLRMVDQEGLSEYSQIIESFFNLSSVVIYPNPGKGIFEFYFHVLDSDNIQVEVVNLSGVVIEIKTQSLDVGSNRLKLDLTGLPEGLYLYRIRVAEWTGSGKLHLVK